MALILNCMGYMANINTYKKVIEVLFTVSALVVLASCAKKGSGVRAIKQTESVMLNPAISKPSIQAADTQQLLYTITSLERPELASESDPQTRIKLEISTPDQRYVPIETMHVDGNDSFGFFDDTQKNGTKLDIRARCEGNQCDRYLLLVTVVKNGYAIHQLAAISYSVDCKFNLENINFTVAPGKMYANLNELSQRNTIKAINDCPIQ